MIIQFVKFKSSLPDSTFMKTVEERAKQFRKLPGLLQKYYVKDNQTGEVGGVYLWDSAESLSEYQQSELASTIPSAYQIESQPRIEILDVLFTVRSENT